jgi:2-polyprenyl-3-methyl-5-hydroxy-6-metoxy-1,4-benzoquinol methylase
MYITPLPEQQTEDFDWHTYFTSPTPPSLPSNFNAGEILDKARRHIKEDPVRITFVLTVLLRNLLKNIPIKKNPKILELGAGTGFLSRWLLEKYGGSATLVDNNISSYEAFKALESENHYDIEYVVDDIFAHQTTKEYDIICSFGLVEHSKDKHDIIKVHQRYLHAEGHAIILVPFDSVLSRVYWEIYPELNLGYRELLSEMDVINMFTQNGLKLLKMEKSHGHSYDIIAGIGKSEMRSESCT